MDYLKDSIDFKNLSLEQKKHAKEVLKKEVKFLSSILSDVQVEGEGNKIKLQKKR